VLKFVFEILVCADGHAVDGQSDPIVELVLFVLQTLLGVLLGVTDFGRLGDRDGLGLFFFGFFVGIESFEKISRDAGLACKTILFEIVEIVAKRGIAREVAGEVVVAMGFRGVGY
jgi:hypothetical protein